MACTPDTVTPKGVLINLNSGSDYTNCTVYTGLTDSTVTGTTNCINVTGTTCSLTGLSATLMEVYVKIDCEGCCSNTFRVNLDECCGYEEVLTPTPTPTYSQTITPTYSQTPTPTSTPSACECNTYRITFNNNCGETINWTDCDTNTPMSEQGDYFGLSNTTFTTGTVLDLCSCSLPTTQCSSYVTISLLTSGCTLVGGFSITTPTPTPTATPCDCYYYTVTISQNDIDNSDDGYVYVSYDDCEDTPIIVPYSAAGEYVNDICVLNTSTPMQYYVFDGLNNLTVDTPVNSLECCIVPTPTPTPTPTETDTLVRSYITLYTSYQLVSGGTTYQVHNTTSNLTDAQTVYCDISTRESGSSLNGNQFSYLGAIGVGTELVNQFFSPAVNISGYFNTSFGVVPGVPTGTSYYIRTDNNGIITHYGQMDYCWIDHSIIWSNNFNCPPHQLVSPTFIDQVYAGGNNNTWTVGTLLYTTAQLTTYYPSARYIEHQGYIWQNDGVNGLIQIGIVGDPC